MNESIDKDAQPFKTYEEAKEKIKIGIVSPKVIKKNEKIIDNLESKLSAGDVNQPLMITKGKGEDIGEEEDKGKDIIVVEPQSQKGKKRPLAMPISPKNTTSRTCAI